MERNSTTTNKDSSTPQLKVEEYTCSLCSGYLSCGPIRVNRNGGTFCGRCHPTSCDVSRVRLLENTLSTMQFPCSYKSKGCRESIGFNRIHHEAECKYAKVVCRLRCGKACSLLELSTHYLRSHTGLVLNTPRFQIEMQYNISGTVLFNLERMKDFIFILRYETQTCNNKLSKISFNIEYGVCKEMQMPHNLRVSCQLHIVPSNMDFYVGYKFDPCIPHYGDIETKVHFRCSEYPNLRDQDTLTLEIDPAMTY